MTNITIDNKIYFVTSGNLKCKNPHIEDSNGEIPIGRQRSLLFAFLRQNNIEPQKDATTYWCVNKILSMKDGKATNENIKAMVVKNSKYLALTKENIENQDELVKKSENYGKEAKIINECFNKYPENKDLNIIAMKIALIDVTNSTQLSKYKGKISLFDLANFIKNIPNFDSRIEQGDPKLVSIIAKNNGSINLFSFASKYCCYHNVEIYKKDDYSIFDSFVRDTLPYYCSEITKFTIEAWRKTYNYVSFNDCIEMILNQNNINVDFRRRKFDRFLWYQNK